MKAPMSQSKLFFYKSEYVVALQGLTGVIEPQASYKSVKQSALTRNTIHNIQSFITNNKY